MSGVATAPAAQGMTCGDCKGPINGAMSCEGCVEGSVEAAYDRGYEDGKDQRTTAAVALRDWARRQRLLLNDITNDEYELLLRCAQDLENEADND